MKEKRADEMTKQERIAWLLKKSAELRKLQRKPCPVCGTMFEAHTNKSVVCGKASCARTYVKQETRRLDNVQREAQTRAQLEYEARERALQRRQDR